ncbi:MAG: non-canonical purine NTP pyrophosphatase [Acidobacteriota bacterium]
MSASDSDAPSLAKPPSFVFVTGNASKRREAERILGRSLDCRPIDLPEIQSLDPIAVLDAKVREAHRRLGRPVVVEETSLALVAMSGFPGPLIKWMLEAMGADGLARSALALDDARAEAICHLAHYDGRTIRIAEGRTAGRLVLPPRGTRGFGWDPVFESAEDGRTFAEMPPDLKDRLGHRGRAWRAFRSRLEADQLL